jgi:hypothetical protein
LCINAWCFVLECIKAALFLAGRGFIQCIRNILLTVQKAVPMFQIFSCVQCQCNVEVIICIICTCMSRLCHIVTHCTRRVTYELQIVNVANTQPRQLNKIQKPVYDPRLLLYLYVWIELTEYWISTEIWDLNKYLSLRTWEIILTNLIH